MQKLTINIDGMKGKDDEQQIISALKNLDGVLLVNIDSTKNTGTVTFNEEEITADEVAESVNSLGYSVAQSEIPQETGYQGSKVTAILGISLLVFFVLYFISRLFT